MILLKFNFIFDVFTEMKTKQESGEPKLVLASVNFLVLNCTKNFWEWQIH